MKEIQIKCNDCNTKNKVVYKQGRIINKKYFLTTCKSCNNLMKVGISNV